MTKKKYPIIEIFDSFQGEGRYLGCPVTFIRFSGCNLDCSWCDTKSGQRVEQLSAQEIASRVNKDHVVFTGGEPTMYKLTPIINLLKDRVSFFSIETNGTNKVVSEIDYIACSPKPGNGYKIDPSIFYHIDCGEPTDFKYVVDDTIKIDDIFTPDTHHNVLIYLQPEWNSFYKSLEKATKLVEELNSRGIDARLGIQAHKFWEVR